MHEMSEITKMENLEIHAIISKRNRTNSTSMCKYKNVTVGFEIKFCSDNF